MIAPKLPRTRRLLRRIIAIERACRAYRPGPRPMPPRPDAADAVLIALAGRYGPGDRVGAGDVAGLTGVSRGAAADIRRWAQHPSVGLWPYRKGKCKPPDWSELPERDELEEMGGGDS